MSVFRSLYRGETKFDFIGSRRRWYLASAILIVICVLSFVFRGFNLGVEFKGGTQFQVPVTGTSITAKQTEHAFAAAGVAAADPARLVGSGKTHQVVVKTKSLTPSEQNTLKDKVTKALGLKQAITVQSVSSSWGHNITVKAIEGLIVFLIVVSIYLSIRFQWRMAVGAFIALIHDLIVAAGIYSIVGFEVTPSTVVGLLTILGFSLYDTVVVYDKVAENSRDITAGSRMTFSQAANLAVNQTLMRSINTSLIALLPVAGLLFVGAGVLGVGTIKDLALILFVGLASGAYSSLLARAGRWRRVAPRRRHSPTCRRPGPSAASRRATTAGQAPVMVVVAESTGDAGPQIAASVASLLRDVPDFPQPGIIFKDLAPLLADRRVFGDVVRALAGFAHEIGDVDLIAGIEARGFLFAAALACELQCGVVTPDRPGRRRAHRHRRRARARLPERATAAGRHCRRPGSLAAARLTTSNARDASGHSSLARSA